MTKWYPVECKHGYDCCPTCDGARRDIVTLKPVDPERTRERNKSFRQRLRSSLGRVNTKGRRQPWDPSGQNTT